MKIAIVGAGYVGLSNAVLLAQRDEVVVLDIDPGRVARVNGRESPVEDVDIGRFLAEQPLQLRATLNPREAYEGVAFVVIATPTDYDPATAPPNHSPQFHVDESVLPLGVRAHVLTAVRFLERGAAD